MTKRSIFATAAVVLLLGGCAQSPAPTTPGAPHKSTSGCGSAKSCEDLGVRYITGDGVRTDGYKAVEYLERACSMGRGSACNGAAFIFADAEGGVKQDYRKALDYWSRACRLGDQTGCANYRLAQDKLAALRRSR
ncbi:hypothetical protein [Nitratifractor sp.]|uniref:hypothetical protein n=1 Tax=Nitratifractor sp. TaxID=2268144 RepID=UPI0025EC48D8|nr:hypothetical protein [Nitratifractor sp.]